MGELTLKDSIKLQEKNYAELLRASGTDVKKFVNNAIMATSDHPDIAQGVVDRGSIFKVCSKAAQDGVMLDNHEAALIIGWNGRTKQKEAQYRLMAGGVMKMITRSPNIEYVACQLVYEGDQFEISFIGDGCPIKHSFKGGSRGDVIGVYAIAKLTSGEWMSPEYMGVDDVNAVRDEFAQKDKNGNHSKAWTTMWGEMARKTILHRYKKRLPLADAVSEALRADDDYDMVDITPQPKAQPEGNSADVVRAQMMEVVDELGEDEVPV